MWNTVTVSLANTNPGFSKRIKLWPTFDSNPMEIGSNVLWVCFFFWIQKWENLVSFSCTIGAETIHSVHCTSRNFKFRNKLICSDIFQNYYLKIGFAGIELCEPWALIERWFISVNSVLLESLPYFYPRNVNFNNPLILFPLQLNLYW